MRLRRRQRTPPPPACPDRWAPLRWKTGQLVTPAQADRLLRINPRRALRGMLPRLAAMGLPDEVTGPAIAAIRSLESWGDAWSRAAARELTYSREQAALGRSEAAAMALRHAAMLYHVGAWEPGEDPRAARAMRSSCATLFSRAIQELDPASTRVELPWKSGHLPGWLARPPALDGPLPLVVLLNGMTTSKEELLLWSEPFLWQGLAVLALDWPGSGEAALSTEPDPDCTGLTGVIRAEAGALGVDPGRIALLGVSLGGALAVRMAARDPRIAAVVAVTPPWDARVWLHRASPLLRRHFAHHAGSEAAMMEYAARFSLREAAPALASPLLVMGAGADMMVPPGEAVMLAAVAGEVATLSWHPGASHALFDRIPAWTAESAAWLAAALR
ncbi:MAG: alpha/beta hydrolase family protein [Chloroflexota bacterium]